MESPDVPEAPFPPSEQSQIDRQVVYPVVLMSFVSRDEAQDEAMLYAAKINRFEAEQVPFNSFIPKVQDIPSSNFVRPDTMRLFKFTRRPPPAAANNPMSEFHAQMAQRRVAHLCT